MVKLVGTALTKQVHYNESMQSVSIRFAFSLFNRNRNTVEPLYPAGKCREYLCDVVHATETGKPISVYGFRFVPEATPIDREQTTLYVDYPTQGSYHNAIRNHHIMNEYEISLGFSPTELFEVEGTAKKALLYVGDKLWQSKAFAISYYSVLIKGMGYKQEEGNDWRLNVMKEQTNEARLLEKLADFTLVDKFLMPLIEKKGSASGLQEECGNSIALHSYTGFYCVFRRDGNEFNYGRNIYTAAFQKLIKK